jgi:hypothetical protein
MVLEAIDAASTDGKAAIGEVAVCPESGRLGATVCVGPTATTSTGLIPIGGRADRSRPSRWTGFESVDWTTGPVNALRLRS